VVTNAEFQHNKGKIGRIKDAVIPYKHEKEDQMPEERVKFALRIPSDLQKLIINMCPRDNCQSQNEFIEKAIRFYAGYVSEKDSSLFLSKSLGSVMRGMLTDTENRMATLLFKLTAELGITMNVLAAMADVDDKTLRKAGFIKREARWRSKGGRSSICFEF
jgi:hypothetical protein